jgi:hypothetical protein
LWEIGAPAAFQKYADVSTERMIQENPAVARAILTALQASDPLIDAVCTIVGHRRAPDADGTPEFMIVHDADWVVRMEDRIKLQPLTAGQLSASIDSELLTAAGKEQARAVLLI